MALTSPTLRVVVLESKTKKNVGEEHDPYESQISATYDAHVIYKVCEYTEKADMQQMWRVSHATVERCKVRAIWGRSASGGLKARKAVPIMYMNR